MTCVVCMSSKRSYVLDPQSWSFGKCSRILQTGAQLAAGPLIVCPRQSVLNKRDAGTAQQCNFQVGDRIRIKTLICCHREYFTMFNEIILSIDNRISLFLTIHFNTDVNRGFITDYISMQ